MTHATKVISRPSASSPSLSPGKRANATRALNVKRDGLMLRPDPARVLVRPFNPSTEQRAVRICARSMALSDEETHNLLSNVLTEFGDRHRHIREFLTRRFEQVKSYLPTDAQLSEERRLLLASYFTHEYSLEAAALFNPSIVLHPDQSELPPGSARVILSLRATGEGHISSVTFRTGILDADGNISVNQPTRYSLEPIPVPNASYDKALFRRKLHELEMAGDFNNAILHQLPDAFTMEDLQAGVNAALAGLPAPNQDAEAAARKMLALAHSNYEVKFSPDSRLSERVLFPVTPAQSNGIEDARFVRFDNEDGTFDYFATYTAYNGRFFLPQFLETRDFLYFKFSTLNGPAVQNKGMALFPRKLGGQYVMLGRQDYENLYLMYSDHPHFWDATQLIVKPTFPWEFIQIGNCGSPLETEAGWLVLSHGVGPMRKYCIGAFVLDKDDPSKVIGRLREPLLKPSENEREGYVPNVVYSCGSMIHNGKLILPYAMSDYATNVATVPLDEVLGAME